MITAMPRIAIAMHDFDGAIHTFRDVMGMPVADLSNDTVPDLGAHIAMCQPKTGSNIELMSPADNSKPLSQTLQKFLDRRGDGLFALMLEAAEPNAEAVDLSARGLEVMSLMPGAGGRDVHPRSTHGVLVRVYPNDSVAQPDGAVSDAPHLSGIIKVIVATAEASLAATPYRHGFGLDVAPAITDDARGVQAVVCSPPKGGVIELVSAQDTTNPFANGIHRFVTERGEGMYCIVLGADDPPAAAAMLESRGMAFGGADGLEAIVCGTRIALT